MANENLILLSFEISNYFLQVDCGSTKLAVSFDIFKIEIVIEVVIVPTCKICLPRGNILSMPIVTPSSEDAGLWNYIVSVKVYELR